MISSNTVKHLKPHVCMHDIYIYDMYVMCVFNYIPRVTSSLFLASDAGWAPTWKRCQLDAVLPCPNPVCTLCQIFQAHCNPETD